MAGNVLDLNRLIVPDQLGTAISEMWTKWDDGRSEKIDSWSELRKYLYATDTSTTTNSKLPWKNTTTTPKLTQIRDNLYANYMATMYPKRRWLKWESGNKEDDQKKKLIEDYAYHMVDHSEFKNEFSKLVYDYIDFGNCFVMPDWRDENQDAQDRNKYGYKGPVPKRISPLDIVFNPIAPSFRDSPKIIRTFETLGSLKDLMLRQSGDTDDKIIAETLFEYFKDIRHNVSTHTGDVSVKDDWLRVDGFQDFRTYLGSNYIEVLYFYGDIYSPEDGTFLKNRKIVVVDRHKVIYNKVEPSYFGRVPIYHAGWRIRQDNLWAMGPLDNLVGMQYRIDHLENLKADVFDLIAFPPLKIKGYVESFDWGPFEKIYVGDDGDVELMSPDTNALQADTQIQLLEQKMEEMAGAPKEAMGFRSPGEKTKYEVQRLENAAGRIYNSKIGQFEEQIVEPYLNAALEMAHRNGVDTTIRSIDPEFGAVIWTQVTAEDIAGSGRLRPVAARHFAEKAEVIQNLTGFFNSPVGQDPGVMRHFSGIKMAKLFEELLEIEDYEVVQENIRLSEDADAQRLNQTAQEDVFVEGQTPTGIADDVPVPTQ